MSSGNYVTYKCPSCGQPLQYSADARRMKCEYCGTEADIEGLDALNKADSENTEFNWGDYKEEFEQTKEQLSNTVTYVCRACGAAIETDEKTVATKCPYCDNDIVVTDKVTGGLKPNFIIPFKINDKEIKERVRNYMKGKKLLPNDFTSTNTLSKIKAVYVPYWMFDAKADGYMTFDATRQRSWQDNDFNYIETQHYLVELDGSMDFVKVPVDSSEKIDDDLMRAVEPYDYKDLVEFDPKYLSGFMADRFDQDPEEALPKIKGRMIQAAENAFKNKLAGNYTTVTYRTNGLKLNHPTVKYALLPVYLLNVKYGGKDYRFAINGQNGKLVGELPIDKAKEKKAFFIPWAISAAVIFAIGTIISFL